MNHLLPPDSLKGQMVGISVSNSPDLARLGLIESHVNVILGEISRTVLASGGTLAYGGHLRPDGYTTFLLSELQRYERGTQPLLTVFLAWSEHQHMTRDELEERLSVESWARVLCLDPGGREIPDPLADRSTEPAPPLQQEAAAHALTSMRRTMAEKTDARILLGGKRERFSGAIPGLMEEALLTLESATPLFLVGGLGGVTVDILRALDVDDCDWLPLDPGAEPEDPRLVTGRRLLMAAREDPRWAGLRNGLSEEENHRLAAAHRPAEIAALLALGLGRIATT
ncbi:hypothetical protein ABZ281_22040 [Streptomyces sp. NPDC006265]|uniref:hypothetical protein n=1 Tax=Streptomyces sp. NPDC006265 TaxID=3156740 RepID=UPI0033A109A2